MAKVRYAYAEFTIIGPFKKAPEPPPGQPRQPEMEGVTRVPARDGAGGFTGNVVYMVNGCPLGPVGVLEGELLVRDEGGDVHVLMKGDKGLVDKANLAGPYFQEGSN